MTSWRRREALALAGAALLPAAAVRAQDGFPDRPIMLVVPWPAGGAIDRHLRELAQLAERHLGQRIVLDNRPGAGGTLAPATVVRPARPDGYTLTQFSMGMLRQPHLQRTAWHPIDDFSFIVGTGATTVSLLVREDSPYRSFDDYVADARARPGQLAYGTPGVGTSTHIFLEELAAIAGIQLRAVPFKGNPELMQAVLGGHVPAVADAAGWEAHVEAGRLRVLVNLNARRMRRWPQVPTARSLGYDIVRTSPYGIVGPRGMDRAVVKQLQDAFLQAMQHPRHQDILDVLNVEPWPVDSERFRQWAQAEFPRQKPVLERLGLLAS